MAGGMKSLQINTQERAISPDINRLQAFKAADIGELLRYWLDVTGNDDLDAGSVVTEPNTLETPLRAEVINGVMVAPQIGSLDLFVTPGVLYALAPDAAPDDSNYKFVKSAGISTLGTLLMTANASGSTRIDVIECSFTDAIVETDNRDIFDPTTGLFTAAAVTKARAGQLTFRVRLGTPGAGYPGAALGWLPLAVATVPDGTVSNDTVTFWDVRPLISDRSFLAGNLTVDMPYIEQAAYTLDDQTNPGDTRMNGTIAVRGPNGRKLGGIIRRTVPGADADYISMVTADHKAPGFAFVSNVPYYVYLLTPFGLPRWAKYAAAPAARLPRSPRGLFVISNTAPRHMTGQPSAAIPLPTALGFAGATTSDGVCVASSVHTGGVTFGGICDGKLFSSAFGVGVLPTSETATSSTYTLTPGTHFPPNAKAIYVLAEETISLGANSSVRVLDGAFQVYPPGATSPIAVVPASFRGDRFSTVAAASYQRKLTGKVPTFNQYPTAVGSAYVLEVTRDLQVDSGTASVASSALTIVGWEM